MKDMSEVLFWAIKNDKIDSFRRTIKYGADINYVDKDCSYRENACTPLIFAVILNEISFVRLLIKARVNVNSQDRFGWTALHWAVRYNLQLVAETLIKAGADLNIKTLEDMTVLDVAVNSYAENTLLLYLKTKGAYHVYRNS